MRVRELVIDGFKSYAAPTVIKGWDSNFNAITGLNGSGKSNILDAICFVLGISNLNQVRATSLQDLIYKRGKQHIKKASVKIVFDNSDIEQRPDGYKDAPEIAIERQIREGGSSKYFINGKTRTERQVVDLLEAVGLPVNHPHFLIMQGKITKVLNMKPKEILGLVQEAAGTRRFEEASIKARKTLEKKDRILEEIKQMLNEFIEPRLQELNEQRQAYIDYQSRAETIANLEKIVRASQFERYKREAESAETCMKRNRNLLEQAQERASAIEGSIAAVRSEKLKLENKAKQEMGENTETHRLQQRIDELDRDISHIKGQIEIKNSEQASERQKRSNMERDQQQANQEVTKQKSKIGLVSKELEKARAVVEDAAKALQNDQDLLTSMTTGLGDGSDSAGPLLGYEKELTEATAEYERCQLRIDSLRQELSAVQNAEGLREKHEQAKKRLDQLDSDVSALEREWAELGITRDEISRIQEKAREIKAQKQELDREISQLQFGLASLNFQYKDPEKNFDRSQVKGTVAKLAVLDKMYEKCLLALETVAGGKLRNVVVTTDEVAAKILQYGGLKNRVTMIPLNKISAATLPAGTILKAKETGRLSLALDLLRCRDPVCQPAFNYVFGKQMVSLDTKSARMCADSLKVPCVTVEGDVYSVGGSLTGGSRAPDMSVLEKLYRLQTLREEVESLNRQEPAIFRNLETAQRATECFKQLEMKTHERNLLRETIDKSEVNVTLKAMEDNQGKLGSEMEKAERLRERRLAMQRRYDELRHRLGTDRESLLRELQQRIQNNAKQLEAKYRPALKDQQGKWESAKLDSEQAEIEAMRLAEKLKMCSESLGRASLELRSLEQALCKVQDKKAQCTFRLAKERENFGQLTNQAEQLEMQLTNLRQEQREVGFGMKQRQHEKEKLERSLREAAGRLRQHVQTHAWVVERAHIINIEEYTEAQLEDMENRLDELLKEQHRMKRSVNMRVHDMISDAEKRQLQTVRHLRKVERDRRGIEETVMDLQVKKSTHVKETWEQVNRVFGEIFGELLPGGNSCRLVSASQGEDDLTQGLNIQVRLGKVWKESLNELSGGQRSLVALSLVLALLNYKPAPLYILDEVDAALDLSHTQNIGSLLGSRFSQAQFIVVSLKEGMFMNANVLFKTSFQNGTSSVERVVGRR